jgi:uncharacterized protein YndB with AHSA1/START domain
METANQPFILTKTFNAPKQAVFNAFANEEALAEWWGPVEAPIEVIKLDFTPGGIFHYKMKGAFTAFGIFRYREIIEPDSITWVNSFADENAEIIKPPFPGIDIPKEILNKITLDEKDGVTTLTLTAEPINAGEKEIKDFYAITGSMEKGFGGTFGQLETYLNRHGYK